MPSLSIATGDSGAEGASAAGLGADAGLGTWWISLTSLMPRTRRRTSSMRSQVPSLDAPSTKRISVCAPIDGIRETTASTLRTSFRQGTTTVQLSGQTRGRGRSGRASTRLTTLA